MNRWLRLALAVFVSLTIVPAAAYAQASITGVVRDTSGAVLPGVSVDVESPALIERVRSAVTDGTGRFRIEELRPGAYTVIFTLPGFATVRREGIELTGTFAATVNAELRVGGVEETITVTGEAPLVDVQRTTYQSVLDQELIDAIPASGRVGQLLQMLPTVSPGGDTVGGDLGGLAGDGTGGNRGGIRARGVGSTMIAVGNVPLTTAGAPGSIQGTVMNLGAYQEVAVDTGGLGSERREGGVRINLIPRDGGNTFAGFVNGNFATHAMQGNNYTQDLRDRGLSVRNSLNKIWEFNPGFGGPIKRDRLWFHWTMRHAGAFQTSPMFFNKNAGDPTKWTYEADTSRPWGDENTVRNWSNVRLTWEATQKNKIGFAFDVSSICDCPRSASVNVSPEAHMANYVDLTPRNNWIADWTAPVTSRLLLQAAAVRRWSFTHRPHQNFFIPPGVPPMIGVQEQSTGLRYRATPSAQETEQSSLFGNVSASYITGAHAFKIGYDFGFGGHESLQFGPDAPLEFRFNNGVPNRITLHALPFLDASNSVERGLFVQDRWTVDRFTMTLGLRYDYFGVTYPELHLGPGQLVPTRNIVLPKTDGIRWHSITPNGGLAVDLFGDGKTALKVNLGRYLDQVADRDDLVGGLAPGERLVTSTTRSWNDANRDFVPDCNLASPAANGECGAMANRDFGTLEPSVTIDPDLISGWNKGQYAWQFSAGVQRELLPWMSLDASYWRTWYGNFIVTDDRAIGPADFDPYSITAPVDPRLPGGGGYVVSGLYDIKPAKFGVPADEFVTFGDNYGKETEIWNGADLMLRARPRPGLLFQGGTSTGRRSTDNCEVVAKLDNPSPLYCHVTGTFQTQFKFLASYTVPRVDVQLTGSVQNLPGPAISASYVASLAQVQPSLGRPLAGGERNVTVNIVEPRTMYGERLSLLDMRIGKILRFGRTRATAHVDLFNVFNKSTVLTLNNSYATWLRPQSILPARFAKVGIELSF